MKILLLLALSLCLPLSFIFGSSDLLCSPSQQTDSLKIIEKVYLHTDRYSYFPGDDIWFKAYLVEGADRILTNHSNNLHVELISPDGKILDSRIVRIMDGLGYGDFHISEKIATGYYRLRAYTNYMRNFGEDLFFTREILVVNSVDSGKEANDSVQNSGSRPEIQFFPEGGSLVENVTSVIAFKATDSLGRGCNVSGNITSSDGTLITTFSTVHNGMGKFLLTPERGKKYFATTGNIKGEVMGYQIPDCRSGGLVMTVAKNKRDTVQLIMRTNDTTLSYLMDKDLELVVSYHKSRICQYTFRIYKRQSTFNLPASSLPDGVLMLTLYDTRDQPLCERLVYISPKKQPALKLSANKTEFHKRDSVSIALTVNNSTDTAAIKTFLAFSATDELLANGYNSSGSNIASWFLLESDIKGYIEHASSYFDDSNTNRLDDLDLLLMTQGWRDFKWKYDVTEFSRENGFSITGKVRKKFLDVPLRNSTVTLCIFGKGNPFVTLLPVDSLGLFSLRNLDFSGKKRLVASVTDDKDRVKGQLIIDTLKYLPPEILKVVPERNDISGTVNYGFNLTAEKQPGTKSTLVKYIQYFEYKAAEQKKYRLSDTIRMGEITVTAKRIEVKESPRTLSRRYLGATPDRELVITPDLNRYSNIYELIINRFVSPFKLDPKVRHRMQNPIYLLDGFRISSEQLTSLPVNMVERVDVLDNPVSYAAFGTMVDVLGGSTSLEETTVLSSKGEKNLAIVPAKNIVKADGVVSIIMKWDYGMTPNPGTVNISYSGYDEPRIFYSPKHQTSLEKDYKPDFRNTLFWEPNIVIDGNRDQVLSFYNGDNSSVVKITVEGLTSSGIPVTASTRYTVH